MNFAVAANNRGAVSAASLGLSGLGATGQVSKKAEKDQQLAREVIEMVRSLSLRPSIVTRYLRVCFQHEHDDTMRCVLRETLRETLREMLREMLRNAEKC